MIAVVMLKKVVLGLVTALLLVSWVGFLVLPLLAPAHVWAARRSSRAGRAAWGAAAGLGAGMTTWAATYVTVGEVQPAIWLLPVVLGVVAAALVGRA